MNTFNIIGEKLREIFFEPVSRAHLEEKRAELQRGPHTRLAERQLQRIDRQISKYTFDDKYRSEQRSMVVVNERITRDRSVTHRYGQNPDVLGGMQVSYYRENAQLINPSPGQKRPEPFLVDRGDVIILRATDRESMRDAVRLLKERFGRDGIECGGDPKDPNVRKMLAEYVRQGCNVHGTKEMRDLFKEVKRETLAEMRYEAREARRNHVVVVEPKPLSVREKVERAREEERHVVKMPELKREQSYGVGV